MYLMLLYVILPLALFLFLLDAMLVDTISGMRDTERLVVWGGLLEHKRMFFLWCTTFILSSVGITSSFYLHVVHSPVQNPIIILIFVCGNMALALYNYVVVKQKTTAVACCLLVILFSDVALFEYTLYMFPVNDASTDIYALLWITHVCNAICVVHAFVIDGIVWHLAWRYQVFRGEPYNFIDDLFKRITVKMYGYHLLIAKPEVSCEVPEPLQFCFE
jgi:hypothetical protein